VFKKTFTKPLPMGAEIITRKSERLAADCSFGRLADLNHAALERWLVARAREGMGARTRNSYFVTAACFANWCADPSVQRLAGNPVAGIPKRDDRGRTLDVHALRTTFGTLLSKGGVMARTTQLQAGTKQNNR
jgi:hypothetical protein